jgi:VTC domain
VSAELEPESELEPGWGGVDDSPVVSALASDVARRAPICLEQVLSVACLTTRFELKYLLPLEALPGLLDRLPRQLAVLDIEDRRIFAYESVYFDTAGYALYRQHMQGRRKRYKARTRSYCDTQDAMFEVKLKGWRGQTVKERLPYDFAHREELTGEGRAFLDDVIGDAYGFAVPALEPVLTTAYRRATLVDLERGSRLTIDVDLRWWDRGSNHRADHLALIESKSPLGPGPVDALMGSLGVRPVRMSKYCLGVALLHPETAANPWHQLLSRQFGWQRTAESDDVDRSCPSMSVSTGGSRADRAITTN